MKKILFVLTILLSGTIGFSQQTKEDIQKEQAQLRRDLAELNSSLSDIRSSRKKSLTELYLVQRKIKTREALVENIQDEIKVLDKDIVGNTESIQRYLKQLDTLKTKYAQSLAFAYKNRNKYDQLNFIFSAASFNDAIKRVTYLKSYRRYREAQVADIKAVQALLRKKVTELNVSKRQKSSALTNQTTELTTLQQDEKEKDESVAELKSREGEISSEIAEKNKRRRKLQANLDRVIQQEIAAARAEAARKEKERREQLARERAAEEERQRQIAAQKAAAEAAEAARKEKERKEALAAADAARQAAKTAAEEQAKKEAIEKLKKQQEEERLADAKRLAEAKKKEEDAAAAVQAAINKTPSAPSEASKDDEIRAKRANSVLETSSESLAESIDFEKNKGNLPWPTNGVVVGTFGTHNIPGTKVQDQNNGIDISPAVGSPVRSVANGTVTGVIDDEGTGDYTIIIRHGKYFTSYSNIRNPTVKKGNEVHGNTVIGSAGQAFDGPGGFISFTISNERSTFLNPESWLRRR
ncbi:MAG: peptidoglycan DD-metalloendopeptidase family protein [Chitinophagaceae bacterium]